ncbi:TPA: hypothetical protein QCP98_000731 [Bacillus cereus]|uniref:hypothetical protein n=1 Tax=Bacillus thuringiensis TaxID=1428 RepID=UPI00080F5DC3|nr:hypothetical protein [Bacillus thuringiensis]ANV70820.1 hypothetical protein BCM43_10000 [Bacillus thuringiensis]HDR4460009.1 hypothetical protein [Bacillus cereus]
MANEIVLWDSPNGASLPANISEVSELTGYINMLSSREIGRINVSFDAGLYDMATEYTWNRTIAVLRDRVMSFGPEFVLEMLGRDEDSLSDTSDFLSDVDVINLSADLGLINKTAKILFLQSSELLKHYLGRDVEDELDITQAQACIKNCVKYVLAMNDDGFSMSFTNFRDVLKREIITENHDIFKSLMTSPYFYKRTTTRTLLNLSKSQKAAELEIVFANMVFIIPSIWNDLLSDDRYPIGFAYAEATNAGNLPLVKALKSVLLKVKGFDYVPESLRSNTFIEAANHLLEVHFGGNNFYNEPAAAKQLLSLGSSIPVPALGKCMTATIACKLGNNWGTSWNAQEYLDQILVNLTDERWEYYFNKIFIGEETILFKLLNHGIVERWCELVKTYDLHTKNITNHQVSQLLQASFNNRNRKVQEIANQLYDDLRG